MDKNILKSFNESIIKNNKIQFFYLLEWIIIGFPAIPTIFVLRYEELPLGTLYL